MCFVLVFGYKSTSGSLLVTTKLVFYELRANAVAPRGQRMTAHGDEHTVQLGPGITLLTWFSTDTLKFHGRPRY